jgi:asparagine synthase (glutamine-hydrolysing)
MMHRLAHRGPDGEGYHGSPGVSVGHRRLAVIDLEQGGQPMLSADGRYLLTYNGEIYNYIELRKELESSGVEFRTTSDTEVLLAMLIRHGAQALTRLNGMYAFVFVDLQTNRWLMVRDCFGIKPLYYAVLDNEIIFASEIKALLEHPDIMPERNWRALQQYLTFQFCLHGETLFRGVRTVEPGFYIEGEGGAIRRSVRYWDTDYHIDESHTEVYFNERLAELLAESVRWQVRSDVPLGSYLSGGMDSSVITSLASRHVQGPLPVFHGRFAEGEAYDESRHARTVCDSISGEYHEVVPTAEAFVEHLPQLIYALDEPVAGPGLFPQYLVSRRAAERVKVVLGGQGGDEIFGGYARYLIGYLEQALKGAIFETQEEGRHVVTLASIVPNLPVLQQYRPLMQHFWKDGLFEPMDSRYFRLIDRSPDAETLLSAEALRHFDREEIFADFQKVFNHPDTAAYLNKMTHFDQKALLPALLQVEDRVSMAASLESRVPLLDRRIVDLVTSMPPAMKFRGGETKHIFKKVVRPLIPASVWGRKDKMGFPIPLRLWLKKGPVRDFACDVLLSQTCRDRGLFSPKALETLLLGEVQIDRQIWGALCLELWHRRFMGGT